MGKIFTERSERRRVSHEGRRGRKTGKCVVGTN